MDLLICLPRQGGRQICMSMDLPSVHVRGGLWAGKLGSLTGSCEIQALHLPGRSDRVFEILGEL